MSLKVCLIVTILLVGLTQGKPQESKTEAVGPGQKCDYTCKSDGSCRVKFLSDESFEGVSGGACYPVGFGGNSPCISTPPQCSECNQKVDCPQPSTPGDKFGGLFGGGFGGGIHGIFGIPSGIPSGINSGSNSGSAEGFQRFQAHCSKTDTRGVKTTKTMTINEIGNNQCSMTVETETIRNGRADSANKLVLVNCSDNPKCEV